MSSDVRTLKVADVASATELSTAANWNQTPEDWQRVLALSPRGCRCIEENGRIAATATLFVYSESLAWIGMVLTRPENRRRGHARHLIEDLLEYAAERGIGTLKLDATDQGKPLYEDCGFVVETTVERWVRHGGHVAGVHQERRRSPGFCEDLMQQDTKAFGVSRQQLLEHLGETGDSVVNPDGYVLSRPGRVARYLGPGVARSAEDARKLIADHLETFPTGTPWYWDVLSSNVEAVRYAEERGFTRSRVLHRMRRGDALEHDNARMYAIAGFELG